MILQFHPRPAGPPRPCQPAQKAGDDTKALDAWIPFVHPSAMEAPDLISTAEICRRYEVTRQAVRLWIAAGLPVAPETPAPGLSGRPPFLLFRAAEVAAFVEARKAAGRWKQGPRGKDKAPRKAGRWPAKDADAA